MVARSGMLITLLWKQIGLKLKDLIGYWLVVSFLLVGCSTGAYKPVDQARVISSVQAEQEGRTSSVLVKRYSALRGSLLDGVFTIDGKEIVKLSRGETYEFQIAPGAYSFGVKSLQPIMMVPVPFFREIPVVCEAGKQHVFMLYPTGGAGLAIDNGEEW